MRPIIFLVIESGAVYSLTLLVLLILYKAQSWFQYVLLDAVRRIFLSAKQSSIQSLDRFRQSS